MTYEERAQLFKDAQATLENVKGCLSVAQMVPDMATQALEDAHNGLVRIELIRTRIKAGMPSG